MTAETAGQRVTAALREELNIGARTRAFRGRRDIRADVLEAVRLAATVPGYFPPAAEAALRPAFGAVCSYDKHVNGFRVDGALRQRITAMTPWQFTALLGAMVDAGVTNVGEGERYFAAMRTGI